MLTNYTTTYAGTHALTGGQTPSGSGASFTITAVAGDDLTCTLTNTRKNQADLRLTKTNTPGVNGEVDQAADTVVSGTTTSYSITVTNNGPRCRERLGAGRPGTDRTTCTRAAPVGTGHTAPPAAVQLAVVQVSPVGAGSANTEPLAASGPLLVTVML